MIVDRSPTTPRWVPFLCPTALARPHQAARCTENPAVTSSLSQASPYSRSQEAPRTCDRLAVLDFHQDRARRWLCRYRQECHRRCGIMPLKVTPPADMRRKCSLLRAVLVAPLSPTSRAASHSFPSAQPRWGRRMLVSTGSLQTAQEPRWGANTSNGESTGGRQPELYLVGPLFSDGRGGWMSIKH